MTARLIDGKAIAAEIQRKLKAEVEALERDHGIVPGLAVILVGGDPASRIYVNSKKRACSRLGMYSEEHCLPASASQREVESLIEELNSNEKIHGILLQLPLPESFDEKRLLERIDPSKDVDGFHPVNVGRLALGYPSFVPCTPAGILELIGRTGVEIKGKHAVVVGRSNIVGKPVAALLLASHATVTVCHSKTTDLVHICRQADILVAAVGRARLIGREYIKPGAVVIDVGINREPEGLVGDVDFEGASQVAGFITPVPGGVGPMTIAMLMKNTILAAGRRSRKI
ncbi:MAG TPA: bifunctional methylenetetrahydrofolate dehydrogenase/methenyltetrahydrofolate cyclohydrolase FolD [Firmicutes bacterium]|nr:bifunctional methylenetetrahydrofolate dehydrogenase/methenyltetrahydrofolate cyclohydrolase FolD [Bacillota bacterium]HHY98304.1 bifunctional methylenetetrahydrofolate dehydrogenase/methenyltetrahydrofolate cyclohydrolase FolD [Bacillota bacterium]